MYTIIDKYGYKLKKTKNNPVNMWENIEDANKELEKRLEIENLRYKSDRGLKVIPV